MTKLFTIGFTQKSAEEFFTLLTDVGVRKVIDIRLNNVSQLAGFAKREDLRYLLKSIAGIDYVQDRKNGESAGSGGRSHCAAQTQVGRRTNISSAGNADILSAHSGK